MDHNRCILCHRCVRACGQLVGNFTLGIEERGSSSMLVADTGVKLGDSTCVSCGTCVSVCPTGALIERQYAYQGLEKYLDTTNTVCAGCSVGCGVIVHTRDNRMVRLLGDWDAPVNGGVLCKVGRFEPMEETRERITTPMVKQNGKLVPVTWDEALTTIATKMKPLAGQPGNGVAALASTRLSVEALSVFKQVFADRFGSDMVTSIEEGVPTSVVSAMAAELGRPFETNLEAVKTSDCVMLVGANLAESHMVAGFLFKRTLPEGTRLIIVDPQPNGMDIHANVVLKASKGADLDILTGIQAGLVKLGLVVGDGVAAEAALTAAADATGISADDLLTAAGMLGTASRPVILYGKGITAQGSVQTLRQLLAVAQNTQSGLLSIKGHANSLAAAQLGLEKAFHLNGHQAVYVALGDEAPSQRLTQRLEKTPFLAVQASYVSRLTADADVVLPVEMWAEQEGHFVNLEGRVQEAHRALTAPAGVRSNVDALKSVAGALGIETNENWQAALCQRPSPVAIAA
jgi:formate dehydrogenase major subunit